MQLSQFVSGIHLKMLYIYFKQFKILDNKRQHEIRIIEIFQTLSANRRKGML
jgi:hypothetical protein